MYRSILNFKDTQVAIKQVKDYFQKELAEALNLMRRDRRTGCSGDGCYDCKRSRYN